MVLARFARRRTTPKSLRAFLALSFRLLHFSCAFTFTLRLPHATFEVMDSMPRKYPWHDFRGPGWYLLTLKSAVRNRNIFAQIDAQGVHPTPLGLLAEEQWRIVCEETKGVLVTEAFQLMADHVHILVKVTSRPPWTIGTKIGAFKARTTSLARQRLGFSKDTPLWGPGYDWRIKETPEKVEIARDYVQNNPEQSLLKRETRNHFGSPAAIHHPRLPPSWPDLPANDSRLSWTAFGNASLLEGNIWPLRVSRKVTAQDLEGLKAQTIARAHKGWICISPVISPDEKEIFRAVLEAGGKVIHLETIFLTPYYRPLSLEACAQGRFLTLSPFSVNYRKRPLDRSMAEHLNACAFAIAQSPYRRNK